MLFTSSHGSIDFDVFAQLARTQQTDGTAIVYYLVVAPSITSSITLSLGNVRGR